ncbi:hypothetical protein EVAR_37075_1 [Eumeta japonica]|uniref:Uncharacterized protein n=1 Tax=Eumeta variegata TaxID=151549 RepID=A0A4C1WGM7_EUMVA|nr:hypothetical protein EVAR_37075_1 [Eumeta japonica]
MKQRTPPFRALGARVCGRAVVHCGTCSCAPVNRTVGPSRPSPNASGHAQLAARPRRPARRDSAVTSSRGSIRPAAVPAVAYLHFIRSAV